MNYKEVKSLSKTELAKKELELKKNLFDLRMKNSLGQLNNPIEIRDTRRMIARVLTAGNSKKSV